MKTAAYTLGVMAKRAAEHGAVYGAQGLRNQNVGWTMPGQSVTNQAAKGVRVQGPPVGAAATQPPSMVFQPGNQFGVTAQSTPKQVEQARQQVVAKP